ncbi:HAD family hydrolase [Sneathiella aquimaris]|uniref:HAD family hydrolase n=1 Tax=Sneathiella aquimaris TaxID=2599305 RepID=UPI00146CA987|nr:HAD family hydrolase [Sneathiella aquimaris]
MHPMNLLFDLDGTLLDTAPDLHNTLNHCLKTFDRDLVSLESVKHMVGQGARVLLEKSLKATGGLPANDEFEELVTLFFDHYRDHLSVHSFPYPAVGETLDHLQKSGCKMGVCTNKPYEFAKTIIHDYQMADYFSVITGGDSFDTRKPDPAHITKTLEILPPLNGPSVMIGDTHNDIDAATSAGIYSIAVTFGYSQTPADQLGATFMIDHFDQLTGILEKISRHHLEKAEGS